MSIREGEMYRTYIAGSMYIATRDSHVANQTKATENRHLKEHRKSDYDVQAYAKECGSMAV